VSPTEIHAFIGRDAGTPSGLAAGRKINERTSLSDTWAQLGEQLPTGMRDEPGSDLCRELQTVGGIVVADHDGIEPCTTLRSIPADHEFLLSFEFDFLPVRGTRTGLILGVPALCDDTLEPEIADGRGDRGRGADELVGATQGVPVGELGQQCTVWTALGERVSSEIYVLELQYVERVIDECVVGQLPASLKRLKGRSSERIQHNDFAVENELSWLQMQ